MKVFFDTNVLVSAFITETGSCAELLQTVLASPSYYPITGEVVLKELQRVLKKRPSYSDEMIQDFVRLLRRREVIPKPDKPFDAPECDDPDDLWILASALEANANVLVTGDDDLLKLKKVKNLIIITPAGFWDLIKSQ